jgi:hypothetical protein
MEGVRRRAGFFACAWVRSDADDLLEPGENDRGDFMESRPYGARCSDGKQQVDRLGWDKFGVRRANLQRVGIVVMDRPAVAHQNLTISL